MRRIVATESVTLDGVMQAPGRADEDLRGGFQYGGWAIPYMDEVIANEMGKDMANGTASGGGIVLGRRTYEDFASFWPHRTDNPYTPALNRAQKYVVSGTRTETLSWENSTLLAGDEAVATLKEQPGADLSVLGSGALVRSLLRRNLVDEFVLLIHPIVLGVGLRLFDDGLPRNTFELTDSVPSTTGVIIARYRRRTDEERP